MRTLVITNCTNRKRISNVSIVAARDLTTGSLQQVVNNWTNLLTTQSLPDKARDTYCGRSFSEALLTMKILGGSFFIVSAGLGLINSETYIPRYNATITVGSEDNVIKKIVNGTARSWWDELNSTSQFSTKFSTEAFDLILVGLAMPYFALLQPMLEMLPESERKKLRLFLRTPASSLPDKLQHALMPYDARFDSTLGPIPGTQGDFPQRAMRHFAEVIVEKNDKRNSIAHALVVEHHLLELEKPNYPKRKKLSDDEIKVLIEKHWYEVDGLSAKMLRFLRDNLQVACEQKRFQSLFNQAKAQRLFLK